MSILGLKGLFPIVFGGQICRLECKIRPAIVAFSESYQQLGNWPDRILFPEFFFGHNCQPEAPNRSTFVTPYTSMPLKALK